MKIKILWTLLSALMVMALVLTSCGPAAVEEKEEVVTGEVTKETIVVVEEAEVEEVEEVVVAEKEMVLDPATGEMVEKPRHGGKITLSGGNILFWDPYFGSVPTGSMTYTNEKLSVFTKKTCFVSINTKVF